MGEKIKIGIIGIGMVGTPLMKWFLERGYKRGVNLFCYDAEPQKNFCDDISEATVIFICVPTPSNHDGSCNISIVESVIKQLPDRSDRRNWCIVVKSTVPPKTTAILCKKYKRKGCFVFNPEFLSEAQADIDFKRPDRQIVAAADEESRRWLNVVLNLLPLGTYNSPGFFQSKESKEKYHFHEASSTEAELAKYGGNMFGAATVTLANVLADFCEKLEIDYEKVRELISHDRRIGPAWKDVYHGNYRGFGGFCFPKDLNALIAFGEYLLKELKQKKKENKVFERALKVLKSIRDYNETLLNSQGLTVESVSVHDSEIEKIIKSKKRKELKHV